MKPSEKIAELLFRYLRNELTPDQQRELDEWRNASTKNEEIFRQEVDLEKIGKDLKEMYAHKDRVWQKMLEKMPELAQIPARKIDFRIVWAAAAATLLLILTVGPALYRRMIYGKEKAPVHLTSIAADIPAGRPQATLTLANGRSILLDTVQKGLLAEQGGSNIMKPDSASLNYLAGSVKELDETQSGYNMLSTPRGGEYNIVLPDGTKVWLNAASSLRYPVAFSTKERKVELIGEAYFEVTKNQMPFTVIVNHRTIVQVLGTHFNIMAYNDEPYEATTLLEGKVKVSLGSENRIITPGEQVKITGRSIVVIRDEDAEAAVAWRNGRTFFKDADVPTILRLISRWYDVDVIYQGNLSPRHINGAISRNAPLSELLKILEMNKIHFKMEGKKMTVTP